MITYLYHKRHIKTGLNYFGKTKNDPYTYTGSGAYWKSHLKKHGKDIETVQIWKFDNLEECSKFALEFSKKYNIVESKDWANLINEDGLGGGQPKGRSKSVEHRKKISDSKLGKPATQAQLDSLRRSRENRIYTPMSIQSKEKLRNSKIGKKATFETKEKLRLDRIRRFEKNQRLYILISPTEKIFILYSISMKQFCLDNGINYSAMVQAARRGIQHRGWKIQRIG